MSACVHTPGPWAQGILLDTAATRRWNRAQRAEQSAFEQRCVFANFTAKDEGRGRQLVGRFENPADAKLASVSPDMLKILRAVVETYDAANPVRTADFHIDCTCMRCIRDSADAIIAKATGGGA